LVLLDVAVSAPFGGEDRQGLVYIYNGFSGGLRPKPSQVIAGQWAAAGGVPSSFGFAMRGANDLDHNGYPGEEEEEEEEEEEVELFVCFLCFSFSPFVLFFSLSVR